MKLRDIYVQCENAFDIHRKKYTENLINQFSTNYTKYITENPIIASALRRAKDQVFERYGALIRSPIPTNRGHVYFFERQGCQRAIKVSLLNYDTSVISDDPVWEARWCCAVSKDGNPAMLPCIESFALGNEFISVTPVATTGTLLSYMLDPQADKTQLRQMFMDLLFAMSYLHNHMRVAHLDLKPENVFLGAGNQVIVGDFGVALAVANEQRESALQQTLQKLQERLQRRGASAQEIEQRKQREIAKFDALYEKSIQDQQLLSNILNAPSHQVPGLLANLSPLTVPLPMFFRPSFQQQGFTYDKIKSINGYVDPNDPQLSGNRLVESFLAYLRRQYPNEADQKRALANFTVRLMPNLPAKLYVAANETDLSVPPAAIEGSRGTQQYMCPALRRGESNPFAADVYSLGVILFIVATGFQPYKSVTERAFYELQKGGVAHLLMLYGKTDRVHPSCLNLIKKMMDFDPKQRPSIDECIRDFGGVTLYPFPPFD